MQVMMEVTERQITPGETARFPFTVPMRERRPSTHSAYTGDLLTHTGTTKADARSP